MNVNDRLERMAMRLAEKAGVTWSELPETDAEAQRLRSPDCCNRLDNKDELREIAFSMWEMFTDATREAAIVEGPKGLASADAVEAFEKSR